jgi:transposase InsO family protein
VDREIRALIRQMSRVNPLWGAPRIHGELLKLGIEISQATVAKYMVRRRGTPSPIWRLRNEAQGIAAIDLFVVASVSFRVLYVMVILGHDRRKIISTAVTEHPTAAWLSRKVTEAFPWDTATRYLLRDRDASYGSDFCSRVAAMGITQVVTAPRSPWQNPYVERVIGSLRRECLDLIVTSTSAICAAPCLRTSTTTIERAPIFRSIRIAPFLARSSHPGSEESPYRKSVACIIATNAWPPDSSSFWSLVLRGRNQ